MEMDGHDYSMQCPRNQLCILGIDSEPEVLQ